ncbi:hypothetical protein, partial [Novipirellula maiorica]|uniref:hypothetical protein n=1 Tax=Novipirellula maiorica TaxID=1265734 RepID=UPI001181BF0B
MDEAGEETSDPDLAQRRQEAMPSKVKALRQLLRDYPRMHCVVAGRPHAINQRFWESLFAEPDGKTSEWDFWLAGMFTGKQRKRFLGPHRANQIARLGAEVNINPRMMDELRSLPLSIFDTLRSGADVYWHSIYQGLTLDRKKPSRQAQTRLKVREILDMLSAIAITMQMWGFDPCFDADIPDPNEARKQGNKIVTEQPVREVPPGMVQSFWHRVHQRLAWVHPSWADDDFETADRKLDQIRELNLNHLQFGFLSYEDESPRWRNATLRDFFAALWMVRCSPTKKHKCLDFGSRESDWFLQRQCKVFAIESGSSRHEALHECWKFLSAMPVAVFNGNQDGTGSKRWLVLIERLFERTQNLSRPTELMYLAWPNLLRRSGYLNRLDWSESDLNEAGMRPLIGDLFNYDATTSKGDHANSIVLDFLREYRAIREGLSGEGAR